MRIMVFFTKKEPYVALQGIHAEIQCTDQSEVKHEYVLEKVRDKERN